MTDKFAVLIPTTNQIGYDTFKDSYKTIIVSKKLNLEEIMQEVHKISKDAKIETLHFTEIIEAKEAIACLHEWDEWHRGIHKCKVCGKFDC